MINQINLNNTNLNTNNFYINIQNKFNEYKIDEENFENVEDASNILHVQKIYLELINNSKLEISGVKFDFNDKEWDFRDLHKEGRKMNKSKFNFGSRGGKEITNDFYINAVKLFTLFNLLKYTPKRELPYELYRSTMLFLLYCEENGVNTIEEIDKDFIEYYIDTLESSYGSQLSRKRAIKNFLNFYAYISNYEIDKDIYTYLNDFDINLFNAERQAGKTKLIPSDLYKKITKTLKENINNEELSKADRGFSGLLFIGTQIGLRTGELMLLRVSDIKVEKVEDLTLYKIYYRNVKSSRAGDYKIVETVANKSVKETFEILTKLYEDERKELNTDLLVPSVLARSMDGKYCAPQDKKLFDYNKKFFIQHANYFNLVNLKEPNCYKSTIKINTKYKNMNEEEKGLAIGDVVSFPSIRQFRVYVASELRAAGVSDLVTASIFGHRVDSMIGYYARPAHPIQEDIDFSKETVRERVENGTKILGPKGEAIMHKIDKIIKDNNFNIKENLNEIIDEVCNTLPIRAKEFGFCIKSNPRRECRHDAKTDEFMCAFNCCPNHCFMYFMIPITYQKIKDLFQIIEYNHKNGFVNATEKEAYKLIFTVEHEFNIELNELKNEITSRGVDEIVKAHEELGEFIKNMNDIEMEVKECLNKAKMLAPKMKQESE